jgi:serine/threonine protein kinase
LHPDSVHLDDDFHVKLIDFGTSFCDTVRGSGALYTAPEVVEGEHTTEADVYSFGLMLYDLVCGSSYFANPENPRELFGRLSQGERPEIPEDVLPMTRSLITRCWAADPGQRPTFDEILKELEEAEYRLMKGTRVSDVRAFLYWIELEKGRRMSGLN